MMLVDEEGHIEGSVTGGCVESALAMEAETTLREGAPRLLQYGVSDELAAEVGLMCGGTVRVFVHELRPEDRELVLGALAAVEAGRPTTLATILDGEHAGAKLRIGEEEIVGTLGEELLERSIVRDARGLHETGESRVREYGLDGRADGTGLRVHHQTWATPARMVIVGVNDFARALADHSGRMGWRVIICDARQAFARSDAVRRLAEVVVDWPNRVLPSLGLTPRDAVVVVTHDPKFDEPALAAALESDAGYIGALGSRQTQAERRERLLETGIDADAWRAWRRRAAWTSAVARPTRPRSRSWPRSSPSATSATAGGWRRHARARAIADGQPLPIDPRRPRGGDRRPAGPRDPRQVNARRCRT